MPTYEYKCENCEHCFEEFQGINDQPLEVCPECDSPVKRLLSGGAGIIFKGSGFYATDYKKQSGTKSLTRCGKEQTCCGRETPCSTPSCEK